MKKSKKDDYSLYIRLDYELLDSAAWTALSYEAQWLYIELKKQFRYDKGGYDHLVLPYSKVSWRMCKNTFWKKIKELINYELIKVVEHGGLMRQPTVYALSEGWKKKSREIVNKEGREAIKLGRAKKRGHGVIENLRSKKSQTQVSNGDTCNYSTGIKW